MYELRIYLGEIHAGGGTRARQLPQMQCRGMEHQEETTPGTTGEVRLARHPDYF